MINKSNVAIRGTLILGALGIVPGIALGVHTKFAVLTKIIIGVGSIFVVLGAAGAVVKKAVDNRLDRKELDREQMIKKQIANSTDVQFWWFKRDGTAMFSVGSKIIYVQQLSKGRNLFFSKFLMWSPEIGGETLGERFLVPGYVLMGDSHLIVPNEFLQCRNKLIEHLR